MISTTDTAVMISSEESMEAEQIASVGDGPV